jgi:hypothetical protein
VEEADIAEATIDDKELVMYEPWLLSKIEFLTRENEQLRIANRQWATALRPRTYTPQPQYMSGRWHRRDGNVYGTSVQPLNRSADANRPTGYLRPSHQR